MTEINYDLFARLAVRPHPLTRNLDLPACDCHHWCGEVSQEAHVSHHLLDLAGIPHGTGYAQNLDARTWQALMLIQSLQERMDRLKTWHAREAGPHGLVGDYCVECGTPWPCDTWEMANGSYID